MLIRVWTWRITLILIAAFLTLGFYKLSQHAFTSLFSAQILEEGQYFTAPKLSYSVKKEEEEVLLFVRAEEYDASVMNPFDPATLFLRVRNTTSSDADRINGYPFIQVALTGTGTIKVELLHNENVIAEKAIEMKDQIVFAEGPELELKGAAPILLSTMAPRKAWSQQFALWQYAALIVLLFLGFCYLLLRIKLLFSQRRLTALPYKTPLEQHRDASGVVEGDALHNGIQKL